MSNPKEKAKELYDKMYLLSPLQKINFYSNSNMAKQCALISVEFAQERVNDVANHIFLDSTDATNDEWNYLEEVKQEIQNL